jgi:uncharacterized sulfatase
MKPTYGDPSYIVRDIYRSENGWWDRNPTTLHPEPPEAVGAAVARAITDKPAVIASAQALARHRPAGPPPMATRPNSPRRALKAAWLRERAAQVASYVSRNLYKVSADMIEQGTQGRFGIR